MKSFLRGAVVAALLLAGAMSVSAQDITAGVVGTLTDPSGAVVANAKITVFSLAQQRDVRTVTTDSSGTYSFPGLSVGAYRITAEATGFKKAVRDNVALNVNDNVSINIALEVGDTTQTVSVAANPVAVQLAGAEQSSTVTGARLREMAIITRNYEQLISILPGVNPSNTDQLYVGNSLPSGLANVIPFSINGTRNSASGYTIDGADNLDRGSNLTTLNTPSIDAIAEFKLERSSYSAELGRAAGGQVSVITKSGTSQFTGDVYEFVRNDAFAANNFLNNANKVNLNAAGQAVLRYNDFGWTLGGPLFIPKVYNKDKNKTFFFVSEEFRRYITYTTNSGIVLPTPAELTGAFPHQVCTSYSGFTSGTCNSFVTQVPQSLVNPVSQAYIKDIFSRIAAPQSGNSLTALFKNVYNFEQELYKVDHIFSPKLTVSARYLRDQIPTTEPGGIFLGSTVPGVGTTNTNSPGHNWVLRATSTFSPTWINEAGYDYSYGAILSYPTGYASSAASPDIKPKLPFPVTLTLVPSLTFSSGASIAGRGPYIDYSSNHAFYDNMTKIVGNHSLKFGITVDKYQKRENAATGNQGSFGFTATAVTGGATAYEQAFADFLVGAVATYSQTNLDLTANMHELQFEAYAQDDWRVNSRLTVSGGVRYSYFPPPTDSLHELTTFDPSLYNASMAPAFTSGGLLTTNAQSYLNGISVVGQNSPYGDAVYGASKKLFAPRLGIAWDPFGNGKTAIRAGYGIFFDSTTVGTAEGDILNGNPPISNAISISNVSIDNPAAGTAAISFTPKSLTAVGPKYQNPYTQQWNLTAERQITQQFKLNVGYAGTKGTHLLGAIDINELPPGFAYSSGLIAQGTVLTTSAAELPLNILRPYKGYNAINTYETWFNSNYNALQVEGTYLLGGDSQLNFAYTWARNMTDNWSDRSNAPQNSYNFNEGEYGRAAYDRRQVFNVNWVYTIPFFRAQKGILGKVLGGWEESTIFYAMTGLPLTPTTSGLDPALLGFMGASAAGGRPDMICNPNQGGAKTRYQWFNTACFAPVPAGVIRPGNEGRGVVVGPGFTKFDLSMSKNFLYRERYRLQIRGEATNAFNHTNPNAVAVAETTPSTFGTVTSFRDPRIVQLVGKFYF